MTTIVDFSLSLGGFVLSDAVAMYPDAEFELVPLAGTVSKLSPLLSVVGVQRELMTAALVDDSTTADVELSSTSGDDGHLLYRVEWESDRPLLDHLTETTGAHIQRARVVSGRWLLKVYFPDSEDVSSTLEFCERRGFDVQIARIYGVEESDETPFDLSQSQYEAVRLALDRGYYNIPQDSTMAELAAELGISQQAFSERLHRAHQNLASNAVSPLRGERRAGDES